MHLISAPRDLLTSLTSIRPHVASARKLTRCSFKACRGQNQLGLCRPKRPACCWCKVATVPKIKNIALATQKEPSAATAMVARLDFEFSPVRKKAMQVHAETTYRTGQTPRRRLAATSKYEIARWLHNCAWRPRATISARRSSVPYGRGRRSNYPCCKSKPR